MAPTKTTTKKTVRKTAKKPAKPARTPRAAKGRKSSGKAPKSGTAAARANRGAPVATPTGKGKASHSKRVSALDAAAEILGKSGREMGTREMIEVMGTRGLWTSPGGKTPHATLYSAITREIAAKGRDSRFKKTGKGMFAASGKRG